VPEPERLSIATQIAVGALRYFMLKFTKSSVIAFDFKEALSFEGETGPYAQYAVVRATNIFRKGGMEPDQFTGEAVDFSKYLSGEGNDEIWVLWLVSSKIYYILDMCIYSTEISCFALYAFLLEISYELLFYLNPLSTTT